jgi:putative PIN family toxin of toxin-antitoxin system
MKIVLDTSVLVAAARSRNGASFKLISMLPIPEIEIALTIAVYTEWQAVMTRPENLPDGATADDALAFLRYLASIAHLQDVYFLWRPFSRDPDDDMIVECAVSAGCDYIVTHNVKDFRRVEELNVQVATPAEILNLLRSKK